MVTRKSDHGIGKIVLAATAGLSATAARADLTFDLRATSVNGSPLSGSQTQHSIPSVGTGDVIKFDVFALVTGTDANFANDMLTLADGSFHSTLVSGGGPLGNLKMDIVRAIRDDNGEIVTHGFNAITSSVGLQQDLDGDGDLDVGSNNNASAANFWAVVATTLPDGITAGLPNGVKVGFGTFTVTSQSLGSTLIRFDGRNAATASGFSQDGFHANAPTNDSTVLNSILVSTVPEPGSIMIVGAGVTCLGYRRRKCPRRAR